jgi:outer membrane lipoprotein SlyB
VALLCCATCIAVSAGAQAQPASRPAPPVPLVESFDLEQVAELAPGVPLNFTVYGSAGATVTLAIEGGQRLVDLPETQAGIYEGAYVIESRDRIRRDSRVVATLQRDGQVARSTLAEPLQLERGTAPWRSATAPPAPAYSAVPLAPVPAPPLPREICAGCAVVESIDVVAARPVGIVGAITGAIAGAAAVHPLGEGHGRRVMTVVGAIAGSWLGREIERRTAGAPTATYRVVLRLADGTALERRYETPPGFKPGDSVDLSGRGTRAAVPPSLL